MMEPLRLKARCRNRRLSPELTMLQNLRPARQLLACSAAAAFCALLLPFSAVAEPLHLVTENYAPMNYVENGEMKGVSVELLKAVMKNAGVDYTMEIMPWARAYGLAENTRNYCVFTTVHNKQRDALFQWIEPLLTGHAYLVRRKGAAVEASTIDQARNYLIGTQRDDYTVDILKEKGFARVDLAPEIKLTLNKLLNGRIDLMPMASGMVIELQQQGVQIEPTMVLTSDINGLACNKETDPAVIGRLRDSLREEIANGTQKQIFDKYAFSETLPE